MLSINLFDYCKRKTNYHSMKFLKNLNKRANPEIGCERNGSTPALNSLRTKLGHVATIIFRDCKRNKIDPHVRILIKGHAACNWRVDLISMFGVATLRLVSFSMHMQSHVRQSCIMQCRALPCVQLTPSGRFSRARMHFARCISRDVPTFATRFSRFRPSDRIFHMHRRGIS